MIEKLLTLTARVPTLEPFLLGAFMSSERLKQERAIDIEETKSLLVAQINGISKAPSLQHMARLMSLIYDLKLATVEVNQHQLFLGKFLEELGIPAVEREVEDEMKEEAVPKKNKRWRRKTKNKNKV